MKCPYHDCQKDYMPGGEKETLINPTLLAKGDGDRNGDGLLIETARCGFCTRQFHEIYRLKAEKKEFGSSCDSVKKELLFAFPSSRTTFEAKKIPRNIKDTFGEAERCRSVDSLTGIGACLRKTIYAICDDKKVSGKDYREKINNLPVKGRYRDLLKQIKWLGDNTTKPGDEKYTMDDADSAIEILPILIEELYGKDEKIEKLEKVLAKARLRK